MHCCIDTSPADRDFRLAARARAGNNEWSTWTSERGKTIRLRESAVVWLCWVLGLGLGWFDGIDTSNVMAASSPLFVPLSRGPFASRSPTSSTFPRYHAPPFQSISLEPVRYRTGIGKVRDGSEAGRQRCAKVDSESSESYLWLGISKLVSPKANGLFLPGNYMGKAPRRPIIGCVVRLPSTRTRASLARFSWQHRPWHDETPRPTRPRQIFKPQGRRQHLYCAARLGATIHLVFWRPGGGANSR